MAKFWQFRTLPLLATLLLSLLVACKRQPAEAPAPAATTPAAAPAALTKVRLQLNWFPEPEHGGYYQGLLKGYYRDAGIDLEIITGGPSTPVESQVASGGVEFGLGTGDRLLITRAEGAPLVALLAPYQTFPRCLVVSEDSPAKTLADIKDMRLIANETQPFMAWLKHSTGLPGVEILPYKGGLALFVQNPVGAIQGYVNSEPLVLQHKGVKTRALMLADAGYNPYTSLLLVSEKLLGDNPDLVGRMVKASRQGWEEYLSDPKLANAELKRLNPEMEDFILTEGMAKLKELMAVPAGQGPFGSMTEARWQKLREQLLACGALKPVTEPISAAFSNRFNP